MARLLQFGVLVCLIGAFAFAEEAAPPTSEVPQKSPQEMLVEKLKKADGTNAAVVIFKTIENPSTPLGTELSRLLVSTLQSFGNFNVRYEDYAMSALTMEDIRLAMARYNVDILITPMLRDGNADIFLFDKRAPYNLYAQSEETPPQMMSYPPTAMAEQMAPVLMKRILYRYLNEQYFELPREESLPVLQAEIPAWIASEDSLALVNRELSSKLYVNLSLGAATNVGRSGEFWNSNLIGAQVGYRVGNRTYLEAGILAFSYNALVGSLRYTFANKESPFKVNIGLGAAFVIRDKSWNVDQTLGLGRYSTYIVPSAALLFPIGDIYLKLEGQMFVSLGFDKFIWTFMPGAQIHF